MARYMPRRRQLTGVFALHLPLATVGVVGTITGLLGVGLLLGNLVVAVRILVFDAPLREAVTLAAGAATGVTLVGAVVALV
jgi:hypothetical protein